ncbi:MAG TPA: tRNA (adenosine(37)-N6)-threonylcarbamoyltransferase complex dimerization subunit type 1 TsaB [Bryobacteraceae bacterium]
MNPRILAIDTTTESGGIALVEGGEAVAEVSISAPQGFGQVIYGAIANTLRDAHWTLAEIDCFAAAAGPGSFTGVRIGVAAAKGLAEALGKPAAGISNLQAVASFGTAPLRAPLLDARRAQVYCALYDASLELVLPETVALLPDFLRTLPEDDVEFLSTSLEPYRAALAGTRFETALAHETPRSLAAAVGRIASARFLRGRAEDPATLDANYVRRCDAEMFWRE